MRQRLILKVPAKLNLHLQVGNTRQDGFHDIKSLFVMVDLYDQIIMSSLKIGNRCEINGSFDCDPEDNLIFKAWKIFCESTGLKKGVVFEVLKTIPSRAGMGGGSSDAAAVLTGLNEMFSTGLTVSQLCSLGVKLGSDVPFFISAPAAVVAGRGEKVAGLESARKLDFVIINPGESVSTADAYRWLDEAPGKRPDFLSEDDIIRIYRGVLDKFNTFQNDFTPVLAGKYPVYSKAIEDLKSAGALYSNVTGSGSMVFGLFKSAKEAEIACKALKSKYKYTQKIKSLDRIPYAILK